MALRAGALRPGPARGAHGRRRVPRAPRGVATDPLVSLSQEDCLRHVADAHFGRIGFTDGDEPTVLPVNYVLDRASSPPAVVFRSTQGSKLTAAIAGMRVAFQVDAIDPIRHAGWSVLVRGRASVVDDPTEIARLRRLPLQPWWPEARDRWLRIDVERVTGRRLRDG